MLIKEYNIATDVGEGGTELDQSTDAIVRVEVHRLRKKLQEYYKDEGAADPLEIQIQPGRYCPEFTARSSVQAEPRAVEKDAPLLKAPHSRG